MITLGRRSRSSGRRRRARHYPAADCPQKGQPLHLELRRKVSESYSEDMLPEKDQDVDVPLEKTGGGRSKSGDEKIRQQTVRTQNDAGKRTAERPGLPENPAARFPPVSRSVLTREVVR